MNVIKHHEGMKVNIMVIDDSNIDLFITKKIIDQSGIDCNVATYTSAMSAINALVNVEDEKNDNLNVMPNYILLDITMREMNGYKFLKAFNKLSDTITSNIKVYLLSFSSKAKYIKTIEVEKTCEGFIDKKHLIQC